MKKQLLRSIKKITQIRYFLIFFSLFLAVIPNIPLYLNIHQSETIDHKWSFTFQLMSMIFAIYLLLLTLISFIDVVRIKQISQKNITNIKQFKVLKFIAILSIVFSGFSCYFIYFYQIVIDKQALLNLIETNPKEALELFSLKMFVFFIAFVVLPVFFMIRYLIIDTENNNNSNQHQSNQKKTFRFLTLNNRLLHILLAFSIIAGNVIFNYQAFASNFRNNRAFLYQITPLNIFYVIPHFIYNQYFKTTLPVKKVIIDVREYQKAITQSTHRKPPFFLWIVGETARRDYFSLDGHPFLTNPELTKIKTELLNLQHDTSCNTYTKGSLPCLFSPFGRDDFSSRKFDYPALPQLMKQVGYQSIWIDNQSGCKGACDGIPTYNINSLKISQIKNLFIHSDKKFDDVCRIPKGFKDNDTFQKFNGDREFGECGDEIMLLLLDSLLKNKVITQEKPTIVFLHQMGSHGPSYYKRVPNYFKKEKVAQKQWFLPTCEEDDLTKCNVQQIQNSYRNTILYTDFMIAQSILWLKNKESEFQTALLYHSDHGESLGENGVYLHGLPYSFAPDSQKNVPIIWWFSENFKQTFGLNSQCLNVINHHENDELKNIKHEDDHLFHSFFGLLKFKSKEVYHQNQDVFATCH